MRLSSICIVPIVLIGYIIKKNNFLSMIEHTTMHVSDYEKARAFYTAALRPLGYKLTMEFAPDAAGFMADGHTSFWIACKPVPKGGGHVAFRAKNKDAVKKFYDAALAAGGEDNGAPGLRKDYSPDYYAAFVFDPDGNNIEAVCFESF